jgi:hypothetical protein
MEHVLAVLGGIALIVVILIDAFETIVLPRRVTRRLRVTRFFALVSWRLWSGVAGHLPGGTEREGSGKRDRLLGVYGPLVLVLLVAL